MRQHCTSLWLQLKSEKKCQVKMENNWNTSKWLMRLLIGTRT